MRVNGSHVYIGRGTVRTSRNSVINKSTGRIRLRTGNRNDQVNVRKLSNNRYGVNVNGVEHTFNRSEMRRLQIDTRGGDDLVNHRSFGGRDREAADRRRERHGSQRR